MASHITGFKFVCVPLGFRIAQSSLLALVQIKLDE